MKWNVTNLKEELRYWKMQINKKFEKNNKWSHKVRKSDLKQSLKTHLQSADSVKQTYNRWKDNNN